MTLEQQRDQQSADLVFAGTQSTPEWENFNDFRSDADKELRRIGADEEESE